jgi:PIN domain nuclease of toxin-antitoxin system
MSQKGYLLDTHALLYWYAHYEVSKEFIAFFDKQVSLGQLYTSSICIWETALLVQKGRIVISHDMETWRNVLLESGIHLLDPTSIEMIDSVQLPRHHKDPVDRLLIAQAISHSLILVTRDQAIQAYNAAQFWM